MSLFKKAAVLFLIVFSLHAGYRFVHRAYFGRFGDSVSQSSPPVLPPPSFPPLSPTPPQFGAPADPGQLLRPPAPLDEGPLPAPPERKGFFHHRPKHEDAASDSSIERQILPGERPGRTSGWEPAGSHFTGAKVFVWARVEGRPTCPPGEALIEAIAANPQGWTIGESPLCHFWVIRVPPNSEICPRIVFCEDGRPIGRPLIGYDGPWELTVIFGRHPLAEPNVERWDRSSSMAPLRLPRGPAAASWTPGLAVRYRTTTDVGVGLGFGSGWSTTPCR